MVVGGVGFEQILERGVRLPNTRGGENYAIVFPGYQGLATVHTYDTGVCEAKDLTHIDGTSWRPQMRSIRITDLSFSLTGIEIQTGIGITSCD